MDETIVPDISTARPTYQPLFWLATRAFVAHTLITILGIAWCATTNQPGIGLLLAFLWLCAYTIWYEWRMA